MSGRCFVDTDILIYAHDRYAGVKHLRAQMLLEQLWDSGWGVVSSQVLEELCIQLCGRSNNPVPLDEVDHLIRDYSAWEVVPKTPASVRAALEIVKHHKTHFWDAMILESAERAGVSILYSEHLAKTPRYKAIQIVNPLVDSASV